MGAAKDSIGAEEIAGELGMVTGTGMPSSKNKPDMPDPDYTVNSTGQHNFSWREDFTGELFKIVVSHPVRSGLDFWCVLSVYYRESEHSKPIGILNGKRWNMTSTSNTDGQLRSLNRRMDGRGWDARIALVEQRLAAEIETGDDLLDLSSIENPPPTAYAVYPFLEEGEHNGVAAEGGSTKSIFAMACCISYSYNEEIIPGATVPVGGRPSLYLDYESTSHTQAYRRRQLLSGTGVAEQSGKIFYKRMYSPITDAANELYDIIKSRNIGLVVIDSAARAVGGETSAEAMVIPFFNAVSSWGVTVLTVAHKAKSAESKGPAGVAQWFNQFRNYWEIVKDQTPGQPEVHLAFRHDKANDESLHEAMNYRLEFKPDSIVYNLELEPRSEKILSQLHVSEQIVAYLKENEAQTVSQIAGGIELTEPHIRGELKKNEGTIFFGSAEKYDRRWSNIAKKEGGEQGYYWEND